MIFRRKRSKLSKNGRQSTEPIRDHKPTGAVRPSRLNREGTKTSDIFSGNILYRPGVRRHYPFVLYFCLLIILYMGYIFSCQRLQREEIACRLRLQKLRSEALLYSSERLDAVRYINLEKQIKERKIGIKPQTTPPIIIRQQNEEQQR